MGRGPGAEKMLRFIAVTIALMTGDTQYRQLSIAKKDTSKELTRIVSGINKDWLRQGERAENKHI